MSPTPDAPQLTLRAPSPRLSSHPESSIVIMDGQQAPIFKLRLNDSQLAPLLPNFPIQLHPMRLAFIGSTVKEALKAPARGELMVEAMVPELLGATPLAHWMLSDLEVADMARANASGGALLLYFESKNRKEPALRVPLSPYWLDWQGWTGYARRVLQSASPPDAQTVRYMAHEMGQRAADPPTGLHTARAFLYAAAGDVGEAAASCQDELILSLTPAQLPSIGALEALALLGELLKTHQENREARAALSLALWLNPNHLPANIEMVSLLDREEQVLDVLGRLAAIPQRTPRYNDLLNQASEQVGIARGALETKIQNRRNDFRRDGLAQMPEWISQNDVRGWLQTLGL